MNKLMIKDAQEKALKNKGIIAFEKYIKRIEWLHPTDEYIPSVKSDRKYIVIDAKTKESVFSADKLFDIAKEFCSSQTRVSECVVEGKLLKKKYIVERCK